MFNNNLKGVIYMAKKSKIAKEQKRIQMVEKYREKEKN